MEIKPPVLLLRSLSDDNILLHGKLSSKSLRENDLHRSSTPNEERRQGDLKKLRPLSKSDFNLSYPEDLDFLCKTFVPDERHHVPVESFASSSSPSTPGPGQGCCPSAIQSSSCATATAQSTIQSINVVQKTHSFFNSLKEKWSKSRSKARGSDTDESPCESPILSRFVRPDTLQQSKTVDCKNPQSTASEFGLSHNWFQKVVSRDSQVRLRRQNSIRSECIDLSTPIKRARLRKYSSNPQRSSLYNTVDLLREGENPLQNETLLKKHDYFQLKIHLKRGKDLIARDKNGLSDPYVKFKMNGRLIFKSKTVYKCLNPTWDETFTYLLENPFEPLFIKVFDYDWGLQDDFMGATQVGLSTLELGKQHELCLQLRDCQNTEYLGELYIDITLSSQSREEREQIQWGAVKSLLKTGKVTDMNKKYKYQIWSSVVTIVLIKIKNIKMNDGLCDPYVRFRLGGEKFKSKGSSRLSTPTWLEQFDLHLFDDQTQELEINVCAKERYREDVVASAFIDLSKMEREKTHKIKYNLDIGGGESAGTLCLLLTISGTSNLEMISDPTEKEITDQDQVRQRYCPVRTLYDLRDIGMLTVRVYKAQGLTSADLCGKSDPFCVLELVNARLQTHTEYKTLSPTWDKIFVFNVKDINSVLEVTVFDEDPDYKVEFLGKVAIPLLSINNGVQKWYPLKDKKLRCRAKGNNPKILLEMRLVWNPLRAVIRTLNPKEEKYMQQETKFKTQTLINNVMRLKLLIMWLIEIGKYFEYWVEWESPLHTILVLITFVVGCQFFEPYMAPIALVLVFLKYYISYSWDSSRTCEDDDDQQMDEDDQQEDQQYDQDDDKTKEEKKSLKDRVVAVQEVTQLVQNTIGDIASLGEKIINLLNFSVPFLSYLSIVLLIAVTVVLYCVPIRYLIMAWGINKFTRKILRPNTIPNNELLDLLSRVPDNEEMISYKELKANENADGDKQNKDVKKKQKL
ncbi:multiple C2 and transmembrane domain-containing protein isoform X2 [Adelges cooleyi]|uniref:multiple C2 and transmembrane domain-containing protein isoform X2 n=1 Tax=Adelges cooleyi TaxID=133065 RepID=UPI00217F4967|nr:multiple C2 and transmembrane domain-containing protein isoform X2 [Adelges cooleyi]